MAFSFRNLFKKEEEELGGSGSATQPPGGEFGAFGTRLPDQRASSPEAEEFHGSPFAPTDSHAPPALPIVVPAYQIIPLIPQELVNPNGIAPEAMVRLPAAGPSGGVKLTEVYQACPPLFAYAPDMRDNREIVIGVHAASGVQQEAQSPFAPSDPAPVETPSTPVWQTASPFEASPTQQPIHDTGSLALSPSQPDHETGFLPQNQQPGFESGSLPPQRPQHESTPFQPAAEQPYQPPSPESQEAFFDPAYGQNSPEANRPVTQELDASALPFAPAPPTEPVEEQGEIELSLLNILRAVSQEDLGFDPEEVPPDVRTVLPISLVRPQLSSGSVIVQLSEIVAGCEERFHPAFANARDGLQVPLPLQEIFHNLPDSGPEGPSTAEIVARQQAEGAPIYDPSAPQQSEAAQEFDAPPQNVPAKAWEQPPTSQPQPDAFAAPAAPAAPAAAAAPAPQTPAEEYPAPETPSPSPFFAPETQEPPHPQPESPPQPAFQSGGLSSEQLLGAPFEPVYSPEENGSPPGAFPQIPAETPPAPAPEPIRHTTESLSTDFAAFDQQTDLEQLALRAIFQVEEKLSPQDVLNLCTSLPGVSACVALHPGGALAAGETGSGFGEDAAGMFENVAGLARGLGIGEADTFTIRTRKGTFSFFSQGDLCLGVLHDPGQPQFGPGTREKLVLVARELGSTMTG